jgi:hypothetical protein
MAKSLSSANEPVRQFVRRHYLRMTDLTRQEESAIRASSTAHALITEAFAKLSDDRYADQAIGLLLYMHHRNFELLEAAIVCFVTGSRAAAEVSARASVETSVNISYVVTGDASLRIHAYFEHYFDDVDRQVGRWESNLSEVTDPEAASFHRASAAYRRRANELVRQWMRDLMGEPREKWPKTVVDRFRALGDVLGYCTFYARMSSETHGDAEETIRCFLGRVQDDRGIFEKMALETVMMTRFHLYYAVSWFLKASIAYAVYYTLPGVLEKLKTELANVDGELLGIAQYVGGLEPGASG